MLKNTKSEKYGENEPLTKTSWITHAIASMKRNAQTNLAICWFFSLLCFVHSLSLGMSVI
jgi:hypothetical protein